MENCYKFRKINKIKTIFCPNHFSNPSARPTNVSLALQDRNGKKYLKT